MLAGIPHQILSNRSNLRGSLVRARTFFFVLDRWRADIMTAIACLPDPETTLLTLQRILEYAEKDDHAERRLSVREAVFQPILIQPLTDDHQPCQTQFQGISRDVSHSGIGFLSPQNIETPFLSIQFQCCNDPGRNAVYVELVHSRLCGPMYICGSRIITDWYKN